MPTTSTPTTLRRRTLTALTAGAATLAVALPAAAVTATIGNDATARASVDSWTNSVTVDTNHPAPFDGYFVQIEYYAQRAGTFRFLIVDETGTVTWVSDQVHVSGRGAAELTLDAPVGVTTGSNLGVVSVGAAVISFDYDASAATILQTRGDGVPAVGETPAYVDPDSLFNPQRVYSMNADVRASSPQICKDGGWQSWGYKNQGQCIASVVASANSGH